MSLKTKFLCFLFGAILCGCYKEEPPPNVVDETRIVEITVPCRAFDNSVKEIKIKVLDVTADSVKKIFATLFKNNFPIYNAYNYTNRTIKGSKVASLHAYGAAIDVNDYINPFYDVLRGASSVIPERLLNKTKDTEKITEELKHSEFVTSEAEVQAILDIIIQRERSDDWFVNREVLRKGMLTRKEVKIFAKNGFTIWGGDWKQPMDFMHFQIPRKLAEHLAAISKEEGARVWQNHLLITKWHLLLAEKLAKSAPKKREELLADHQIKCQLDGNYFAAANSKEETKACVNDARQKIKAY